MRDNTKAAADNRMGIMTLNRAILAVVYVVYRQGQSEELRNPQRSLPQASRRQLQVYQVLPVLRSRSVAEQRGSVGLKKDPEVTNERGGNP